MSPKWPPFNFSPPLPMNNQTESISRSSFVVRREIRPTGGAVCMTQTIGTEDEALPGPFGGSCRMHHLRTRWQYCVVLAMAGLFSAAACAQEVSVAPLREQRDAASPSMDTTTGATPESPVHALSLLTSDFSRPTSPFLADS